MLQRAAAVAFLIGLNETLQLDDVLDLAGILPLVVEPVVVDGKQVITLILPAWTMKGLLLGI
jgi:hypothetical protein